MKWSYKTVHFELKKEGLLGGAFLDEAEIEEQLNDYGRSGWELISVLEVQDGIIAFFKQSLNFKLSPLHPSEEEEATGYADEDDETFEPVSPPDPYTMEVQDSEQNMITEEDHLDRHEEVLEELPLPYGSASGAAKQEYSNDELEKETFDDRGTDQKHEEQEEDPFESGIGAIKIE